MAYKNIYLETVIYCYLFIILCLYFGSIFRFQTFLILFLDFHFQFLENGTVVPKARMILLINVLKHKFFV
jgi:hypothetical protein